MTRLAGHIITTSTKLVTEECISCGVLFAMPDELNDRLRETPTTAFYCPNGHKQWYTGKTDAQKEREKRELAERQLATERSRRDQAQAEAEHQRHRANGYKGALTKTKRRVGKGVCPCCNRSFTDLADHMETKHPDYASVDGRAPLPS